MILQDYDNKIQSYVKSNPRINHDTLGVLLTVDSIYGDLPEDLHTFRKMYPNFDPGVSPRSHHGITFLKIAASKEPISVIKQRLNADINIKFNDIVHSKDYRKNMVTFKRYSIIASCVIDEILKRAAFPLEIVDVLEEKDEARACYDYYQMLTVYKSTRDRRLKFELLRKLGLVVLIARINRYIEIEPLNNSMRNVWKAFIKGLGLSRKTMSEYYFWLNPDHELVVYQDKIHHVGPYQKDIKKRKPRACNQYPMQKVVCHSFRTFYGNEIIHMEIRNKLRENGKLSYTSYIEKMLRQNLEFPNQVCDTIGVKIVLNKEDGIPRIIGDLESFLGGSLSRKREKDVYNQFKRSDFVEYSSNEYYVWKAVYDIPLPHPSIPIVEKMIFLTKGNKQAQEELKRTLTYYLNNPLDFVIEVQLQDVKSYLLSLAKGSPTQHDRLKTNQIRSNSFYKLFPKEMYERDVIELKHTLLKSFPKQPIQHHMAQGSR